MINIKSLRFWCNKILPLVYDDSLSYYELLNKVVDFCNKLLDNQNEIREILAQYGTDIESLKKDVKDLQDELEKVKNGDYLSLYIDSLQNWIDQNIQSLVARVVKYVFFGLNDDGHFVAYIPEAWEFLTFDTIMSTDDELYGHLVLQW
jgi:hypothetical protein